MKTLVIYDTRHGFTEKCVQLLKNEAGVEIELFHLEKDAPPPRWDDFESVVIGGPVYFGKYSSKIVQFVTLHKSVLLSKRLLLFVVSLSPKVAAQKYLREGIPQELVDHAAKCFFFGGGITWKNLSWWERIILKNVRDIRTDVSNFDIHEIHNISNLLASKAP